MKCLGVCARCIFRAVSYSVSWCVCFGDVLAFLLMMMSVFASIGLVRTGSDRLAFL